MITNTAINVSVKWIAYLHVRKVTMRTIPTGNTGDENRHINQTAESCSTELKGTTELGDNWVTAFANIDLCSFKMQKGITHAIYCIYIEMVASKLWRQMALRYWWKHCLDGLYYPTANISPRTRSWSCTAAVVRKWSKQHTNTHSNIYTASISCAVW